MLEDTSIPAYPSPTAHALEMPRAASRDSFKHGRGSHNRSLAQWCLLVDLPRSTGAADRNVACSPPKVEAAKQQA